MQIDTRYMLQIGTLIVGMVAGSGCDREADKVDRYKILQASWEETAITKTSDGKFSDPVAVTVKRLVKFDSATGRAWVWNRTVMIGTNDQSAWIEMTESGYPLTSSQSRIH